MLKVVYYARVSAEEEKQVDALSKQVDELELFINNNNEWILTDKYIDKGKSGTTTKGRTQYNRLFNDIATNKFDIIVIKDQSRLMRNVLDWYLFMDSLNKNNKKLYLYLERNFYTPDNAFLTGIKAMMAEEYSRDLSKKISSAAKRSQINGTVYGSNRMLGYNQAKGKMAIVESEAEIVRFIFNSYIAGNGFRKIAQQLDEMGVKSSTNTDFSLSTLKRMIRNEKYKGLLISRKSIKNFETKQTVPADKSEWIYIENGVPAIVDEEVWNKANEILKERVKKIEIKDNDVYTGYFNGGYALSGKIECGKCGNPYWHNSYHTKVAKEKRENWQCSSYRKWGKNSKRGCNNISIKNEEINDIVKQSIYEFSLNKDEIKESIEMLKKVIKDNNNDSLIQKTELDLNKLKSRKDNLLDTLLDGIITKEQYANKKDSIDLEISEAEHRLSELNKNNNTLSKTNKLKAIENHLLNKIKSKDCVTDEMINNFVEKVVVYPDKIKIVLPTGIKEYANVSEYRLLRSQVQITKSNCYSANANIEIMLVANI